VPGHWELALLAVVVLLLFGSSRVPQIARQLGRGVREVRDTVRDVDVRNDMRDALEAPEDEARSAAPRED
jgi:TatA/E family protein of Tat protein translocase